MSLRLPVIAILCCICLAYVRCTNTKANVPPMFVALDEKKTGLDFSNNLTNTADFNLFKYMYFYNGSGIGAADFNNDGLVDIFFGSNQGRNKMFLNRGNLQFKDATVAAGIPDDGGWTTGISVVDINNDGLQDIYVCRVGNYETLHSKNQLLINQGLDADGNPRFADSAMAYGLDFSGFSTQAAFFDYDNDGDLDVFLLNHSVHPSSNFRPRSSFAETTDTLAGDRMFRNNGNRYADVTAQSGINSTSIGYGLGLVVSDINLDGYPDIYIGNDFHENDYLYINQKNGSFKEEGATGLSHTSQYSMGVDVADINNDASPEIISMDMLSADPHVLKRSLSEGAHDILNLKADYGYSYQFTRNNLQYNRRNGLFSEIGLYSGIAATDWSWAPLWMDFDNDGLKDLFISNGIPKRTNDIDYVNFISSGEVQDKIASSDRHAKDLSLIKRIPERKIPNKFYRNGGNLSFVDEEALVTGNEPSFSNGAVYADFDSDGDLDIVVNNIDQPATLYENKTAAPQAKQSLQLNLKGPPGNKTAIGALAVLYAGSEVRTYENFPVRGFLSSMQTPLLLGLKNTTVDSLVVVWPDQRFQKLRFTAGETRKDISYQPNLPKFDYSTLSKTFSQENITLQDITTQAGLQFLHQEDRFAEFDREPLVPHMTSTEGPAVAVGDINGDGLEDIFMGGARDKKSAVFLQQPSGKFTKTVQLPLEADSVYEDTDACWTDINNDGSLDLVVASGGNEFYGNDFHNAPRIYTNNGKGQLAKLLNPFGNVYLTASTVVASDIDGDGYKDLFIGGRTVPWAYGEMPRSYLLLNNRNGSFRDVTAAYAKDLGQVGMVTRAVWFDIDNDRDEDLLLSLEWDGIVAFLREGGKFTKKVLSDKRGWWNFILPCDVDGDGKVDLIAGNLGLNSRLKAAAQQPVRLYYNDFDGNGKKEQVLTYYLAGREIPFASKAELEEQIPMLRKKFLYAENLAEASLGEIFGEDKIKTAAVLSADYFANALFLNKGDLRFEAKALPSEAQFSSFKDAVAINANGDSLPDILLMGNFHNSNFEMGLYDADFGTLLINQGQGSFYNTPLNGSPVKGQVRRLKPVTIGNRQSFLIAKNNDSARLVRVIGH